MSSSEKRTDELIDRLVLDIKALVLLQGSETQLKAKVQGKIANSHDESIRRFVEALQPGRPPAVVRLVAMAMGELLIASILVLAGTVALVPPVAGVRTPEQLLQYFASNVAGTLGTSPLASYLSFLEFGVGAVLMVSAFYALRQAAANLKAAGLAVKTGEA